MIYENVIALLALLSALGVVTDVQTVQLQEAVAEIEEVDSTSEMAPKIPETRTSYGTFSVPYYSQFSDISSPEWKKVGCGIASLAMLIEFYNPGTVNVDTLLTQGIASRAFLASAGWTYAGLINLAERYSVTGSSYDLGGESMDTAYAAFTQALEKGPVMASVHYEFDPTSTIPHLVIINGVEGDMVYYNDPAGKKNGTISVAQFKRAWKKRYLEFWPIA